MPIFIPGRQKSYFDDPFGEDDPLEGVRDMNTGRVPDWIEALGNKATPEFRPEKNDMPDMPDMPSMTDPFEGIPESARPKSTLRTQIEELIKRRPQIDEKPSIAKAIAAGLFGGVQGYLNTSPARAVHQDPGATDAFVKSLKMGNYDLKDRNWANQLKDLELMDTLEGRDKAEAIAEKRAESDEALKKAQAKYYEARPDMEKNKGENANYRAELKQGGDYFKRLPKEVQDALNEGKPDNEKWGPDDWVGGPVYKEVFKRLNYGDLGDVRRDVAETGKEGRLGAASIAAEASKENTVTRTGSQERIADKKVEGQKASASIRANAPAKERPARPGDAEAEQLKLTRSAEDAYQREMDRLDRQFNIGTGFGAASSPDKLKPEAKASYMSRKNTLDAALAKRKEEISNLGSVRKSGQRSAPTSKPTSIPSEILSKVPEGARFKAPDGTIWRKVGGKAIQQ